ncbi:MAG: hypothetical protein C4318_06975 [Acidimicrobiia bacterium]
MNPRASGVENNSNSTVTVGESRGELFTPNADYAFVITPEPTPEETSAITAAVVAIMQSEASASTERQRATIEPSKKRAAWKAARRPRPTPHLMKGLEPSFAWKLSGLLGKPYGR